MTNDEGLKLAFYGGFMPSHFRDILPLLAAPHRNLSHSSFPPIRGFPSAPSPAHPTTYDSFFGGWSVPQ